MKTIYLLLLSYLFLGTTTVHAIPIINGSLNNPGIDIIVPGGPHNGKTPLNWFQSGLDPRDLNRDGSFFTTADVFDPVLSSVNGYSWVSSSDGGTFTHGIGMNGWQEGIQQTITGLTPGLQYELTFEQSSSRSIWSNGISGYWQTSFGTETYNTDLLAARDLNAWFFQSIFFTATATEQELSFLAVSSNGNRVDLAIDGIALAPVPEPGTVTLMASGLIGLAFYQWKRRRSSE